jgi:hypothetical protein
VRATSVSRLSRIENVTRKGTPFDSARNDLLVSGWPNPVRACAASPGGLFLRSCATATGNLLTDGRAEIILEMLAFLLHTKHDIHRSIAEIAITVLG